MLRRWNFEIELDVDNKQVPVYKQLAAKIQKMIETGILKNGDLLPGGREIAQKLNVSRKTVLSAMELLVYSGWLENRERVGLFVRNPQPSPNKVSQHSDVASPPPHDPIATSSAPSLIINDGYPDTQLLPFKELSSAFRQLFNRAARWQMLGYNDPLGNVRLRTALSQGICYERGLQTSIEQLMLTRGSQQALYLVAHVLLHPGDAVVVEDPGYLNARRAFESGGLRVLPVPVDKEGLQTDKLRELLATESGIRALYVTPRYQYPTTVTLSSARRRKLAELVNAHNLLVIEDDFGCNFQFTEHHLKPLSVLLSPEHYIYIGTFSKILAPALRLGFVVTTPVFIKQMGDYRQLVDMQGDNVMERAILDLIENGELKRHIRRASKIYRERLQYATELIRKELGENVCYKKPDGGLAFWMEFPADPTDRLVQSGISVSIVKLSDQRFGMRVGYASMQKDEMERLIMALR